MQLGQVPSERQIISRMWHHKDAEEYPPSLSSFSHGSISPLAIVSLPVLGKLLMAQ